MNTARKPAWERRRYPPRPDRSDLMGFTLIELLVVIATVALLGALLLPALASSKPDSQSFQCRNNQRQIVLAWRIYAEDNNDLLAPNDWYSGGGAPPQAYFGPRRNQLNWVGGAMDNRPGNLEATNTVMLVQWAALGAYNTNAATYHCPADTSYLAGIGRRVRSVSMNAAVGTYWNTAANPPAHPQRGEPVGGTWLDGNFRLGPSAHWQTYGKLSAIANPNPAQLFVVADEHPDSINDPVFFVALGIPDTNGDPTYTTIIDTPASYHNGAATFAFADGHCESHQWIGARIKRPVTGSTAGANNYSADDSLADLRWLQHRTTARK